MDATNIFTVTPMNQRISLKPGETYEGYIVVSNPADAAEDFSYKVTVSPYGVSGTDYRVDLVNNSAFTQVTKWVTLENSTGKLAPNETAHVDFKITVPEDAPVGGQYAALMVGFDGKNDEGSGVAIRNKFQMASLLFVNIEGELDHQGEIVENSVPGFVTELPVKTHITLKNDGNTHEVAKIALEVRSFFSPAIIYPEAGDDSVLEEVIMPSTTRELTQEIGNISPLGVYEVTQTVIYMDSTASVMKQVVVSCPIWFMVLIAATIAVIAGTVIGIIKHNKKKRVVF